MGNKGNDIFSRNAQIPAHEHVHGWKAQWWIITSSLVLLQRLASIGLPWLPGHPSPYWTSTLPSPSPYVSWCVWPLPPAKWRLIHLSGISLPLRTPSPPRTHCFYSVYFTSFLWLSYPKVLLRDVFKWHMNEKTNNLTTELIGEGPEAVKKPLKVWEERSLDVSWLRSCGRAKAVRQKEGENVPSLNRIFPWKVSGNTPWPQKRKPYPGWERGQIDASLNPPECTSFSFIFWTSKDFKHPTFCFYHLEHAAFGDWWRTAPRSFFTSLFSMSDRRS